MKMLLKKPQGSALRSFQRPPVSHRARLVTVRAESGSTESTSEKLATSQEAAPHSSAEPSVPASNPDVKIKRTLSDLNLLLGIDEEEEARQKAKAKEVKPPKQEVTAMSISPEVIKQIADAEAARSGQSEMAKPLTDQLTRIIEQAKKVAEAESDTNPDAEQKLRKEFEGLLTILKPDSAVKKEDLERIKKELMNPVTTFYVTETRALEDLTGGYLVRGNVRGKDSLAVFDAVVTGVRTMFDGKYEALVVDDPIALAEGDLDLKTNKPKTAFMIVPAGVTQPPPSSPWQYIAALLLLVLTLGTSLQLGIVANVTKLPPETIKALSNPELYDPNQPIPGLNDVEILDYVSSALPIAFGSLFIGGTHELGHRIAASIRKIKLGPSFFLPNGQLGSFGAVTQIKSLVRSRSDLWDVAFSGPLAGALASFALFFGGLYLSTSGQTQPTDLIPVPTQLFQGSLLLGGFARVALGAQAMSSASVGIHPLVIAGWCGLVTTALNLLPVGCLDGGRMMQAAFGRPALNITSLFSYLGLALGLLGSSLSLPFGLYILFLQRDPEKYVQNEVSGVSEQKQTVTAIAMIIALLVLLPLAPEINDATMSIGPNSLFI